MLNARSRKNLEGVHPDLVSVVEKARERVEFLVTEGRRSKERQLQLVKAGKSQTTNSRHLYGLAVDLCDPDGCYDIPDMKDIARHMKAAAAELNVPIVWGGDWKNFKDTPHFELDRKHYPDNGDMKPRVVKVTPGAAAATGATAGAGGAVAALPAVPAPPDLSQWTAWQGVGDQASALVTWAMTKPLLTMALVAWIVVLAFWSRLPALARG